MSGFACSRRKPSGWGRFTGGSGATDPPVRKSGTRPARPAPETLPCARPVTPCGPSAESFGRSRPSPKAGSCRPPALFLSLERLGGEEPELGGADRRLGAVGDTQLGDY